jgi:hypothetical protein
MGLPPGPSIAPSVAVDLDDGLGEGLGRLLRQVVTDARPLLRLAQGPERHPELLREQFRLLPGGEGAALVDLAKQGQVGVGTLGPAARRSMSRTWVSFLRRRTVARNEVSVSPHPTSDAGEGSLRTAVGGMR